jgi:hypothetical protein
MKTALCVVVLVCGVAYATVQQSQRASALQAIVATERSFARMSAERGTRESFLAYIADDGLLFRPGAVNGKKWLLEHPERVPQKRPLLSWQPAFGDVAQAGDLGYRLFRENSYPFEGRVESSQALSVRISDGELLNGQPLGADVSLSEDLGFTHGTYSLSREQQPDKVIELGSYVRIWRRQNGNWKIVLDITNAWPPTQQSG